MTLRLTLDTIRFPCGCCLSLHRCCCRRYRCLLLHCVCALQFGEQLSFPGDAVVHLAATSPARQSFVDRKQRMRDAVGSVFGSEGVFLVHRLWRAWDLCVQLHPAVTLVPGTVSLSRLGSRTPVWAAVRLCGCMFGVCGVCAVLVGAGDMWWRRDGVLTGVIGASIVGTLYLTGVAVLSRRR